MSRTTQLLGAIALPLVVGLTAAYFTADGVRGWYETIRRPEWNPPNWLFGPVWTLLYLMMGYSLFRVLRAAVPKKRKTAALLFFGIQLLFNGLWSFLFFSLHRIDLAFWNILALWFSILITIYLFARIDRRAAWLLVPYISWVSFAALLNFAIWTLNT